MASLQFRNGRRFIQFKHPVRGRKTLRLGKISNAAAESVRAHVDQLAATVASGLPLCGQVRAWLQRISDDLYARLAAVSLVEPREAQVAVTLDGFVKAYIAGRAEIRPNTLRNFEQSRRILTDFLGKDRDIHSVTPGDGDAFKEHLAREGYAPATRAREIKRARQFFKAAVRRRLIAENPFDGVKAGGQANNERHFFIDETLTRAVLAACPTDEWRLIFALSRYQGLRCPSETLNLRWSDIDWERGVLHVRPIKTKGRVLPIFPEVRPLLAAVSPPAVGGDQHVLPSFGGRTDANLRTEFLRILKKAGIPAWTRPFHNLRSSRETELCYAFPLHVVTAWLGNSKKVAEDHYLQVTPADIQKATQIPTHQVTAGGGKTLQAETETAISPAFAKDTAVQIPPREVNRLTTVSFSLWATVGNGRHILVSSSYKARLQISAEP